MNVATITMEPEAAREKLKAYRRQLHRRSDEEYQAAVKAYESLAQGLPLLNLVDAFTVTGVGEDYRPKLAIGRADRKQVYMRWSDDTLRFSTLANRWQHDYRGSLDIKIPLPKQGEARSQYIEGYSLVPMVPADVRPDGALKNFFVLWEVEQWASKPILAYPDRDPYLLRHITGDLYAVVAEWDLTDVERMVMTGRRQVM